MTDFTLDTEPTNGEGDTEHPTYEPDNSNFLRLRGLPYTATLDDIREFFGGDVDVLDVHFVNNFEGKPSGEAYIQVATEENMGEALKKHQSNMGKRYVEVFTIADIESNQIVRRMKRRAAASHQGYIRIRGIPFSCTEQELRDFFKDLNLVEVVFGKEPGGRMTGECYVSFGSKADAENASHLSGQYLGKRYLEIFNVDGDQFENFSDAMSAPPSMSSNAPNGPRQHNNAIGGGDSYSSPGYSAPPFPSRQSNYSSYQEPQTNYGNGQNYNQQYGYNRPPQTSRGPPSAMPTSMSRNAVYDPYGYSNSTYGHQPSQGGYGQPSQGGYGQPPQGYNASYGGNYGSGRQSYGGHQPYGGPQHSYSNDFNQHKSRGRFIAGEMLNERKVFVRGLPYRVTAKEIEQFFYPLEIVEIKTGVLGDGRASGDGIIEFNTEADAKEALSRDKNSIKTRYIEVFSAENAKISGRTSYRAILSRNSSGYQARDQQELGPHKPLFAPWYAL